MEAVRSFIAFDIENDAVLKKLAETQSMLAKTGADLKLVEPKNIHVTLRFLGNITQSMIGEIFEKMKTVQFIPFNVKIHGLGAFPNPHYANVVWVGITEGSDQLRSVFSQLEPCLQRLGFSPDSKGFSPHLTIARVRSGRNKAELGRFISDNANQEIGVMRAECLRLKKSDLTSKGPVYSTLKEVCSKE